MVKNYLKIAYRNLLRNKLYSVINILGLAVGLAATILVAVYVLDEISYDQFHQKKDKIYRLSFTEQRQDDLFKYAKIPFPSKEVLMEGIPEIKSYTRFYNNTVVSGAAMIHVDDEIYAETGIWFVDPNLLEIFDFKLLQGNPETILQDRNSVVLTEETAIKYFGSTDVIGKSISYYQNSNLTVTGIIQKPPSNSHIQFDLLLPVERLRQWWVENYAYDFEVDWKWAGSYSYVLLEDGADIQAIEEKAAQIVKDHFQEIDESFQLVFFPMNDIYLKSDYSGEMSAVGSLDKLYLFSAIAAIILLVAAINFMNLATARSIKRAREVGIRKVMGAKKGLLISQFLGESLLIASIALFHSLLLVNLTLPLFNLFTGKVYSFSDTLFQPDILIAALVTTFVVGIVSGLYPAFFLSSFKPAKTLKNDLKVNGNVSVRKVLVIAQFAIAITFIAAVFIINEQLSFIHNKDLGFNKEQTLIINNRTLDPKQFNLLQNELLKSANIKDVYLGHIPGRRPWGNTIIPEGRTADEAISTDILYAGYKIVDFFNIELADGRSFDPKIDIDSINERSSFLINERMVDFLGWENVALNKEFHWIGGNNNKQLIKGRVVGVIKDFHHASLYKEIKPLIIRLSQWGEVAIKFKPKETGPVVKFVEDKWLELFPDQRFEYSFMDEDLKAQYEKEENLASLINYFTFLAIFISCLGLFGLASFIVEQRKKEFAIRKTLGATIRHISVLVTSDFGKLIFIAAVIGCPIAWYYMDDWLNSFQYRIDISAWYFALALFAGLAVAFLTISMQVVRAAKTNPVDSLRNE
ncbi:MAG: FtsX-like permease family protein [Cyclobacteriaceae bacterium]